MTMLKVPPVGGLDGLLAYYAGLAEDRRRGGRGRGPVDYYLDPDEPPGCWRGEGLAGLGLSGEVTGEQLRAVLEGRHPVTGAQLGRAFGNSSARGFDATFSAPKSVSALWALSPDRWVRVEVLAAHDAAVDAALGWFAAHGAVTRRGRDGVLQVDTRGVAVAVFRQHTSRTVDPQLHSHALIAAKVQDPTGRWLSLDARFLKYQQRTIGWVYDAALRAELTARLGVEWEPTLDGPADLVCVPAEVRDVLSQRSIQVAAKLDDLIGRWSAENDGADPDPRTIASLERSAVTSSRPGKSHGTDPAGLHDTWRHQVTRVGFDPDQLIVDRISHATHRPGLSDDALIAEALRRVSEEQSTWLRADIARHLTTLISPSQTRGASELVARIDRLAADADARCVGLAPGRADSVTCRRDGRPVLEHVTDRRLTTETVLRQEDALQRWAEHHTQPTLTGTDDPQATAADAIAGTDRVVLVVGPAGTGKTTTTAQAVQHLTADGRPVIGLAPSGKAADVLRAEAGCETDTVAGFLTRHQHHSTRWPAGTTVIVDEAGMARTTDLVRLAALAEQHHWRIVAVGDPAQLPAVGRGGVFAHWCNTLPHHRLDTPRRFTEPWEAAASLALRAGDPTAADSYADHHRLDTIHPALVARDVADTHRRMTDRGNTVAITTNTAETARTINREIRRRIDPAERRPSRQLADGTHVSVGDQIATRRNHQRLVTDQGEAVRNRHTWTVTHLHQGGALTVAHPDRGIVTLSANYVDQHVELGWAVTGYGNQGDTVDIGLAVLEPGTTRNHAYVALTRGRHTNHGWIPDPTGTLDPADALANMIDRTPNAHSALATQRQLRDAAGLVAPGKAVSTEHPDARRAPPPPSPPAPSRIDRPAPGVDSSSAETDLDAKVKAMQRRLNRLQPDSPGRELGL
ncbi:MAG: relaxase domain-containing protein [Acidimicrobiia bacterium]|nr:relaxase domain-containing protein [Acidimicrobiia bacterium]